MSTSPEEAVDVSVVILTMGARPTELARALDSVRDQDEVRVEAIVVGNGWQPEGLPGWVRTVHLPENVGVGGRNAGADIATGEFLFFLDDDAWLPSADSLAKVVALFREHPGIGMVQTRIVDPGEPTAPRYWVPRLRKGDPARPSTCMYVMEAAVAVRRELFRRVGGWPADFMYAHEGIDLTWRIWNAGAIVWYAGDLTTCHPAILPTRHVTYQRLNARNRVWLARRNLPWPVAAAYLGSWTLVERLRARSDHEAWAQWRQGWHEGWAEAPPRNPISWRTVTTMAKHGRPPII